MAEPERKTCDYPGCSSAIYVTVREHRSDRIERLCLAHHRLTSKHFRHERDAKNFYHPMC